MDVGVVVPAYRPDPERLVGYVHDIVERLDPAVVRVEIDAPTASVRERLAGLPARATVNAVDRRRGKGAAVTAGFEALDQPVLAFVDADGSTPAASFANVVEPVVDGRADLAVGSRRHPESSVGSHQTLGRRFLGDAFAWLARRALDVELYDYQCGAKALSAEAWTAVREHLHEPGFAWDIELVAVADALGNEVCEVPVQWEDRPGSTVSPLGDGYRLARGLVVARHRARLLRDDRLHAALATHAGESAALVDRLAADAADE
jgi:glycosyltransferase involved in cell wall biosynthesis